MVEQVINATQNLFDDTLSDMNEYLEDLLESEVTGPWEAHKGPFLIFDNDRDFK